MYKIKASFITKPNATPEEIRGLLLTQGPIGISVDLCGIFRQVYEVTKEMYSLYLYRIKLSINTTAINR